MTPLKRSRLQSSLLLSPPRVKTPEQAVKLTIADLQRAISCVTKVQLAANRLAGSGPKGLIAVTFKGRSARAKVANKIWIAVSINLQPAREEPGSAFWRTHTKRYSFSIWGSETGRTEFLSYDYHPPTGQLWPHIHVNGKADWRPTGLRRSHIATGRMTLEHFVMLLIDEFNVIALRKTWRKTLDDNLKIFARRRTW
jgi:hypothetical protein